MTIDTFAFYAVCAVLVFVARVAQVTRSKLQYSDKLMRVRTDMLLSQLRELQEAAEKIADAHNSLADYVNTND